LPRKSYHHKRHSETQGKDKFPFKKFVRAGYADTSRSFDFDWLAPHFAQDDKF